MHTDQGLHIVTTAELEAAHRDALLAGARVFSLAGHQISDKQSFFEEVQRVLPLEPPLQMVNLVWDALSDSLWEGLHECRCERIVILWRNADRLARASHNVFRFAIDVLASVVSGLADERAAVGSPTQVALVIERSLVPNEDAERWDPMLPTPVWVDITELRDGGDGLDVGIEYEGDAAVSRLARVRFTRWVAYRNINESYRLRTWSLSDIAVVGSLLVVRNSRWVAWLVEESGGLLVASELTHYAIYTGDDCIDVVAREPPTIASVEPDSP